MKKDSQILGNVNNTHKTPPNIKTNSQQSPLNEKADFHSRTLLVMRRGYSCACVCVSVCAKARVQKRV